MSRVVSLARRPAEGRTVRGLARSRPVLDPLRGPTALAVTLIAAAPLALAGPAAPARADAPDHAPGRPVTAVATGYGGAVSTVDADASATAIQVLREGGNAVDAAVAATATLGVTEPYVAALGGGGFFTYYDARSKRVHTIDGRETAPRAMRPDSFIDPATGGPLPFDEAVTSGLSVGVPGVPAQWELALRRYGTRSLPRLLRPAIAVAERGFTVDQEFHDQTSVNAARFAAIPPTRELFLPGGRPPAVGSTFRNPDLARTYRELARHGIGRLYTGGLADDIVRTVRHPPVDPAAGRVVRPGLLTRADLARYRALPRPPTKVNYRGLEVYGMAPPSSGGSTVGEALNILEEFRLRRADPVGALHLYLEASKLAYADRNRYIGDPAQVRVPLRGLLSQSYARERGCLIDPARAATAPVPPGDPGAGGAACPQPAGQPVETGYEGPQTTHLVVSDRWGNVVSYTLTIEQFGGSGLTVPGRGFLLNNELTDFSFAPAAPGDPNLPGPGKRPRSSMAPTIVLRDGRPWLAVGTPGGSTIITTVLQILLNRIDLGMPLPAALGAPRATQRNTAQTLAEPAFIERYGAALRARGHVIEPFTGPPPGQIGAATGLEFLSPGLVQAVAEPVRRHGGSAMVVRPAR